MQVIVAFGDSEMIIRLGVVQTVVSGCCDFMAQCIMVRINHSKYLSEILNHPFIHLNLQRYTVVGFCGIKISVSLSFLHSWQSHT